MSFSITETKGAARTSRAGMINEFSSSQGRLVQPPPSQSLLSEGIARFLLRQEQEGAAELTLANYRQTAFKLLEFLGCDPPLSELTAETAPRWLDWLRTTPIYRRKRGAYPAHFTRQSISAFFAWTPPKREQERLPSAETISKYRREGSAMLRWLGIPVEIERRKRRRFRRLPPIVPKIDAIAARWEAVLAAGSDHRITTTHARQIVLTQALILLWGVRLKEALTADAGDTEGHWVLCTGKTGMRLNYLNSQALGLVQALRGQTTWDWAADRHTRVSAWPWSVNRWHAFVREAGIDDGSKPQQDLRKRFSTWTAAKDREVEMLLAGHGGGVIFDHYLDTLARVPAVMEQFELPKLDGFTWPDPDYPHRPPEAHEWTAVDEARAAEALGPPRRLYARFDHWLEEQERRAAS